MLSTLPVLMGLSWMPTFPAPKTGATAARPLDAQQSAEAAETIRCPLTGEQIPSCCCPVKQ